MNSLDVLLDWARRPNESADEYQAFMVWLKSEERGTPNDLTVAMRHAWAQRAAAFDAAGKLEQMPAAEQRLAFSSLIPTVKLMALQTYAKQLASGHATVSPQDLRTLQEIDRTGAGISDGAPDVDVSKMTDEQRRYYKELCEMMGRS